MRGLVCVCALIVVVVADAAVAVEPTRYETQFTFSRESDQGDNPGTLFEVRDRDGKPIAAAGYLGAYNTFPRSDRDELQFFVRQSDPEADWKIERLPRIGGNSTGYYPFQLAGELYVSTRNGVDSRVHHWDPNSKTWNAVSDMGNGTERIAGKNFHVSADRILYDGQVILKPADSCRFGEHYYSGGLLILRRFRADENSPVNEFQVYEWNPSSGLLPRQIDNLTLSLPQPREFVYTFGSWHGEILAITNMGGVYRLRVQGWDTMRSPIPTVSYQIYCGINYRDSLLLGHYPTGEIYQYAGDQLVLKTGWPPVMPGVSRNAREAQTVAIYNGDLYCGVWPWGEVWRFDGADWKFVQRMFSHPTVANTVTHPYEAETKLVDKVYNLWGQRVTGMIPYKGSLIITTSSKGGSPWGPKFDFLSEEQRSDYGAIYQASLPGQASLQLPPSAAPIHVTVVANENALKLIVNGEDKASLLSSPELVKRLNTGETTIGNGLYGLSSMKFESVQIKSSSVAN